MAEIRMTPNEILSTIQNIDDSIQKLSKISFQLNNLMKDISSEWVDSDVCHLQNFFVQTFAPSLDEMSKSLILLKEKLETLENERVLLESQLMEDILANDISIHE